MNPRWVRLLRVLVVFALGGWIAGALVLGTNADTWFGAELTSAYALQAAMAAVVACLPWSPLLAWARVRWPLRLIVGQVVGMTGLFLYFFFWPPELQAGRLAAWRTAGLFITVYWKVLVPVSAVAGALSCVWARRTVQPPRWQLIAEAADSPEEPG